MKFEILATKIRMAEICGVLQVTLLLYLIWIPSGFSQEDLESSPGDAEENEGFGGTFSLKDFKSWIDGHKIELMNYVVQLNESVDIKSPIDPAPQGLHWFSLNMEEELPSSTGRKPGLASSHFFDKFLKTYNKSWARAFTFSRRNTFLNITQVNLGYADVFRLHVDDSEKDNESKSEGFDVAITLMTYSSHECGFKGMPQNAKWGDLFILNCRVTVNGLWNASLVFRNSYDGSEIRGEVTKCGHQPSVGSRICSTVRVNVNANILAYTCNLEFPADQREEPKNVMFQKSKWTTKFNREVVCFLPKVYLETIPADVSFLCNNMPCEEIVEVNDNIRCVGYGYPQPEFDLRVTMDNSTEKEALRRMFAHVEKIHVYAENGGTIRTVKSFPGPEDGRTVNDDESDERRAQLMEEVTALTQQFMEEYGPNTEEVKLKELYNSIVENYTFPDLEYKSQVFMDSDNGGEDGGNSASPDGTAGAFSDGDEPSFTRFTDGGISEQQMTTDWNSNDRYGDTTKEEGNSASPDGTAGAFSDGDEPSFTRFTGGSISEQQMTTDWNSGAPDSGTVSEDDEDDEMTTQAPESAENKLNSFKDYQVQQTDVGHIEVSCNVSNVLGWGYIVMSLQVLSSTGEIEPSTINPIQPDTTMSAVTVDEETFTSDKATYEPGRETGEPDKATSEPDKEPDEYTRKYTEESELPLMSKTGMDYSEVTDGYLTSARYSVWESDGTQKISEPTEDARRGTYSGSVGEDLETTLEDARRGTGSRKVDEDLKTTAEGVPTAVLAGEAAGDIGYEEETEDTEAEEAAGVIAREEAASVSLPVDSGPITTDGGGGGIQSTTKTGAADHNVQSIVLELFLLICGVCLTQIQL